MPTLVDEMLALGLVSTATTVVNIQKNCKEYCSCGTVNSEKPKELLLHCKHFNMEAFSRPKTRAESFTARRLPYGSAYRGG